MWELRTHHITVRQHFESQRVCWKEAFITPFIQSANLPWTSFICQEGPGSSTHSDWHLSKYIVHILMLRKVIHSHWTDKSQSKHLLSGNTTCHFKSSAQLFCSDWKLPSGWLQQLSLYQCQALLTTTEEAVETTQGRVEILKWRGWWPFWWCFRKKEVFLQ